MCVWCARGAVATTKYYTSPPPPFEFTVVRVNFMFVKIYFELVAVYPTATAGKYTGCVCVRSMHPAHFPCSWCAKIIASALRLHSLRLSLSLTIIAFLRTSFRLPPNAVSSIILNISPYFERSHKIVTLTHCRIPEKYETFLATAWFAVVQNSLQRAYIHTCVYSVQRAFFYIQVHKMNTCTRTNKPTNERMNKCPNVRTYIQLLLLLMLYVCAHTLSHTHIHIRYNFIFGISHRLVYVFYLFICRRWFSSFLCHLTVRMCVSAGHTVPL